MQTMAQSMEGICLRQKHQKPIKNLYQMLIIFNFY